MAEYNQFVSYNNQQQPDYADLLEPGYRFCPTDPELIVYYLKPKIETGKRHPSCRYYEVNIYDYSPDELTAKPEYRSYENKWYFLTPRKRKHANGNRPNRQTKNGGTWKIAQKGEPVKDVTKKVVGTRTPLAYLDEKKHKTPWLMYEYMTTNPNIPVGSDKQNQDKKKLTDWVLCKIYKKNEPKQISNNNVGNLHEAAIFEKHHLLEDEPSPTRRRLSINQENNQWNGPQHAQIQESDLNNHMVLMSNQESDLNNVYVGCSQTLQSTSMDTSTNLITMQPLAMFSGSDSIQPEEVQDHTQALAMKQVQNQSWPTPTQGYKLSSGASSSYSMVLPQEDHVQASTVQLESNTDPLITMQEVDFSQNPRDEVFQQHDDTPNFSNESWMVPDDEFFNNVESCMIALESEDDPVSLDLPESYYGDDFDPML